MIFYHGSSVCGITELYPCSTAHDDTSSPVIYLTPNRAYALFYIRDKDINYVTCGVTAEGYVRCWFDPIPVKYIDGKKVMLDGHTRAVAAYLAGWDSVPVYTDEDEINLHAYLTDIKWCDEEGIHSPADLAGCIVTHKDYERLWRKRCMEMKD